MATGDIPQLLEQRNGVSFLECLQMCMSNREFTSEWERISGKKLIATNPLDRMIDKATGHDMAIMQEFANFVYECVFSTFAVETASQ